MANNTEIVLEDELQGEDEFTLEMMLRFYVGLPRFAERSERIETILNDRKQRNEQKQQ